MRGHSRTQIINDAIRFAREIHKRDYRRDGKTPYFIHPKRVANLVRAVGGSEKQIALAYLHDTLENYNKGQDIIKKKIKALFGVGLLNSVLFLTRNKHEDYFDYIKKIKRNKEILLIKLCDMIDNLSDEPTEKQKKKYIKAITLLVDF